MKLLVDDWQEQLAALKKQASARLYEAAMSGGGGPLPATPTSEPTPDPTPTPTPRPWGGPVEVE
jgi:hypothetical protein